MVMNMLEAHLSLFLNQTQNSKVPLLFGSGDSSIHLIIWKFLVGTSEFASLKILALSLCGVFLLGMCKMINGALFTDVFMMHIFNSRSLQSNVCYFHQECDVI